MDTFKYQKENSLEKRTFESNRIKEKYSSKIPVIIEMSPGEKNLQDIDKHKYLLPNDLTLGKFMHVIRKRIKLNSEHALFFFIVNETNPSGIIGSPGQSVGEIYNQHKSEDNFLYIRYTSENTFGF